MGLLDQVIDGVFGGDGKLASASGAGGMSPLMTALLAVLASRATGHGSLSNESLGDLLDRSHRADPPGMDASALNPGGHVATGVTDPGAALGAGGPTDDIGGGFGSAGGLEGMLGGGLGVLVERFTERGQRHVIDSWIGSGQNRPIDQGQLHEALGDDTVATLAHETGLSQDALLSELSRALPDAVDALTPDGRLPDENRMARSA